MTKLFDYVVVVVAVLLMPTRVHAAWSDGHVGVDRPGGDLPNMPVLLPVHANVASIGDDAGNNNNNTNNNNSNNNNQTRACFELCEANLACKAWAFAFAPPVPQVDESPSKPLLRRQRDTGDDASQDDGNNDDIIATNNQYTSPNHAEPPSRLSYSRCWLKGSVPPMVWVDGDVATANNTNIAATVSGVARSSLLPYAFKPVSLSKLAPGGWLAQQLTTQVGRVKGR